MAEPVIVELAVNGQPRHRNRHVPRTPASIAPGGQILDVPFSRPLV